VIGVIDQFALDCHEVGTGLLFSGEGAHGAYRVESRRYAAGLSAAAPV
jgi:hypothetical protein